MVYKIYKFEYDIGKSKLNLEKHGIDFTDSQKLWEDENLLQIEANSQDEPRYLIIGKMDHKIWSAVITYRKKVIRIISVRRSSKIEIGLYEKEKD
jgi:uncharacterized DUF497 family protein